MSQAFLQAMSQAASSVCVVTTDGTFGRSGVTVSSMTSVTVGTTKPSLLVCVHHLSQAVPAIRRNGVYCVNLLKSDQRAISDSFAGRTDAKGFDQFAFGQWDEAESGVPVLRDALASFECRLTQDLQVGTHHVFFGEVDRVKSGETGAPLLYHNRGYAVPSDAPFVA